MGLATRVGLLPTLRGGGPARFILMVSLRLLQDWLGGEYGGSNVRWGARDTRQGGYDTA
jgi:hypothetical protein